MSRQDRSLTTAELAERWNMSPYTLAHWRKRGKGPAWFRLSQSVNSGVRYHLSDVLAHEAALRSGDPHTPRSGPRAAEGAS